MHSVPAAPPGTEFGARLFLWELESQAAPAGALKPVYWQALAVVVVLYFARFDWSFVVLRAKTVSPTPSA